MSSDHERRFLERRFAAPDGLQLYARDYGTENSLTASRPVVFCLPGLTRNSRDFHQLALFLSRDPIAPYRVVTLDSRGRGRSAWDADKSRYNLAVEAGDVVAACAVLGVKRAAFIGTSRGGLILHLLAASHPGMLAAVVLNDIGPVIENQGLGQIRDYLNRPRKPADINEAIEMLKENHARSFTALGDADWRDMAEAIYTSIDGRITADFDPAIAEQLKSADLEAPLPDLWPQFEAMRDIPLMTIRGENSALLSVATLQEMASRHPGMVVKTASGQGHAPILHLGDVPLAIRDFLSAI